MGRSFRCPGCLPPVRSGCPFTWRRIAGVLGRLGLCLAILHAGVAGAFDIAGPPGSTRFGTSVKVLPNGNIVVTDYDGPVAGIGAVYLYTPTGTLISTITGSQTNDHVGAGGIVVLANGNYVIRSPLWHNGLAASAGAVTWASGTSGVSGVVSAANSLVGSSADDSAGLHDVVALTNGNYVVNVPAWDSAGKVDVGAAAWGNGNGGTVGAVSASNALVGSQADDQVGNGELFGSVGVLALSNGNYVVVSLYWADGATANVGAVTWGNGSSGTTGPVSPANSLVGSTAFDSIGSQGVIALPNGNYVVASYTWDNGANADAGAATWGNGNGGTVGAISAANSLVGTTSGDQVGDSVTRLTNGNYVVASRAWHNGANANAGAVTWAKGDGTTVGAVSASNSLVGATAGDQVGFAVTALSNGHYVAQSPAWSNGTAGVGAATWGNGNGGTVGPVLPGNSLTGSTAGDLVGVSVTALTNGNYVVRSYVWDNGGTVDAGEATWGNGNGGTVGVVSAGNSLVGTSTADSVGYLVNALSNGNYIVGNFFWDNGTADLGAATWGNGNGGTVGPVSALNSLVGSTASDLVGIYVTPLANGNYIVGTPYWDNGGSADVGEVMLARGTGGTSGPVTAAAALVGSTPGDHVGNEATTALPNGSYVVRSTDWDNGGVMNAGALTLRRGSDRRGATITAENSVRGGVANVGYSLTFDYDVARDQLVVGRPYENIVTLFKADLLLRDGFE